MLSSGWNKISKVFKQLYLDMIFIALSFAICYLSRNQWEPHNYIWKDYLFYFSLFIIGRIFVNFLFGIYKQIWRYINYRDLFKTLISILIFSVFLVPLNYLYSLSISFGFILTELLFTSIFLLTIRLVRRNLYEYIHFQTSKNRKHYENVILVGAGEAGQQILREIHLNSALKLKVEGFLDDDESKIGKTIRDIPVLGKISEVQNIVLGSNIKQLIICMPSADKEDLKRITSLCVKTGIPTKILPGFADIINGSANLDKIREVDIADILNREEIKFDFDSINYLNNSKILVTGAGGSIGSELCRQIATFNPLEILLLGKGENSIYLIEEELKEKYPNLKTVPIIADIKDRNRINYVLKKYAPDIIFHAAAHKHVPLMEQNPADAIMNNVIGTENIAELAGIYGVKKFIMISTDKAVNSTNIMGASKKVSELIVQSLANNHIQNVNFMELSRKISSLISDASEYYNQIGTKYSIVRFGNVLGSRGSVIPKFKKQIAKGGPVTVTHPEIIRYFMTIPEAAQLIIQAGNIGSNGEIFILDMGKPVKIAKLAKELIILSGKVPDQDIKIEYTGLRPGEKLYEELLTSEEGIIATNYGRIFIAPYVDIDLEFVLTKVDDLKQAAIANNNEKIRQILTEELKVLKPLLDPVKCMAS
jgi:FlaA1/EpsC-like NDP-sugar epimerase